MRVLEHFSKNTRYNVTKGRWTNEYLLISGGRTWNIPPQNLHASSDIHSIDTGIIVHGYSGDQGDNPIIGVFENGEYAYSDMCFDTQCYINGERWFGNYYVGADDDSDGDDIGNLHFYFLLYL